jgi:crossover junction endodeoxyribonuclease RuvC
MALADRLARLHTGISAVVLQHAPTEAAVEAPFHGASARSALQLAHARGVVLAVLGIARVPVFEYSPATIKRAVTGNGRAEKEQVEAMVSRLVAGGCPAGKSDIADAIAAAICHLFGRPHADALRRAEASRLLRSAQLRRP